MKGELSRYDAVTAKARAMFAKRLRREDYMKMAEMKTVSDVAVHLHTHTYWSLALESVDTAALRRERLEFLLRWHSSTHFLRLFSYVRHEDRFMLRYPVLLAEMEQIMRFMRLAASRHSGDYIFGLPESFKRYSNIQYDLLPDAKTYDDLLEAVKKTDFYTPLRRLRAQNGDFPPYFSVETQMRRYYYRALAEMLSGRKDKSAALLREAAGIQADWENITIIDRILRYYPNLSPEALGYLMPAGAHLRPRELTSMISLDNADSLRELLKATHYGPFLKEREDDSLEKIGQTRLMTFYRRIMASGSPSIIIPIAYINLYLNELRNIIHTIESVRYSLTPEETERYLILV